MGYNDPLIDSMGAGPGPSTLRHQRGPRPRRRSPSPFKPSSSPVQPLFTTFTLPKQHDDTPLATKLWLQSRVGYSPSYGRPFTVANTGIQLDLIRVLWPRCANVLYKERWHLGPAAVIYVLGTLIDGATDIARTWTAVQLLDLVDRSFRGKPATWAEALTAAGYSVAFTIVNKARMAVWNWSSSYLEQYISFEVEKAHLRTILTLDFQARKNPVYMDIIQDASCFSGDQYRETSNRFSVDSAWTHFARIGSVISSVVEISSQLAIIAHTIAKASPDSRITAGNSILLGLSLAPTVLTLCQERVSAWLDPYRDQENSPRLREVENEIDGTAQFTHRSSQLELVLFGYGNWVLNRWADLKAEQRAMQQTWRSRSSFLQDALDIVGTALEHGFYIVLATQSVPTTLSLGALTMHKDAAEQLLWSCRGLKERFREAYQVPFFLGAFLLSLEGPQRLGPQLDYEAHRDSEARGMRIEARNIGFTYPGATKPALHDINLIIEPGESLAIVGFNGGGKTTLAKTLLGLNNHSGQLLINGHEIDDYNAETLHKRMSCLFQDFVKYRNSLRVNVGLGDSARMDDDEAIEHALVRGGASGVCEKIGGLDSRLDTYPKDFDHADNDDSSGNDEDENGESSDLDNHDHANTRTEGDGDDQSGNREIDGPDAAPILLSGSDVIPHNMMSSKGISGGQWQRVAISRAFMRADTADLVVFDEPSASLDPRAEAELFNRIHALSMRDGRRATTTVFISHRFSTVRRADKIAMMENGTIIEYGSHAELMELRGKYCELFELQRSGFDD